MNCIDCNKPIEIKETGLSVGYGLTLENKPICYDCCATIDKMELYALQRKEKYLLYFDGSKIINWPSSLQIKPLRIKRGWHNTARIRYDTWFVLNNKTYHGVTYGNNTQIHHIQITKH